jgi:hypothetical protein
MKYPFGKPAKITGSKAATRSSECKVGIPDLCRLFAFRALIRVNPGRKAWTVVGVLPSHFIFPDPRFEPDVYVPAADLSTGTSLGSTKVTLEMVPTIGRLRKGVSLRQAQAQLNLFFRNRERGTHRSSCRH